MKKNNYVQQLWADNPVFIVWKKIPLSMKLLFVFSGHKKADCIPPRSMKRNDLLIKQIINRH